MVGATPIKEPTMAGTNKAYKIPRSAFLKLWHTTYVEGGSLNDLVNKVRAAYDANQQAVDGELPEFDATKCKQKCDRIIKYATDNNKNAPKRLPGHENLSAALDGFDW